MADCSCNTRRICITIEGEAVVGERGQGQSVAHFEGLLVAEASVLLLPQMVAVALILINAMLQLQLQSNLLHISRAAEGGVGAARAGLGATF